MFIISPDEAVGTNQLVFELSSLVFLNQSFRNTGHIKK